MSLILGEHAQEQVKHAADALSLTTLAATLMGLLPQIAALVSIVWGLIRIYETHTVQRLLGRRGRRRDDGSPHESPHP